MVDGNDLGEEDGDKLATAHSQFPTHFSKAYHIAMTFLFLAASLLKVKKCKASPR